MLLSCIFLLLLCFSSGIACANIVELSERHISTVDGLASNSVRHIYQDSNGFLWFGTLNSGLCRYDGNSFTTIYPQYNNAITLTDPRINSIQEDNFHHLWILTLSDGVSCYDLETEQFVDYTGNGNFNDKYNYIAFIGDEVWLWGRTQGCRVIRFQEGKFSSEVFTAENEALSSNYVTFIHAGVDHRVWIGTNNGLTCYENGEARRIEQGSHFIHAAQMHHHDYFLSDDGRIRRAESDASLTNRAQISGVIPHRVMIPGELTLNEEWVIFTTHGGYLYNPVNDRLSRAPKSLDFKNGQVLQNNKGNYLVYNRSDKVYYIDASSGKVTPVSVNSHEVGDYWTERYSFFEDSRGLVWISTHTNGLFALNPASNQIQHIQLQQHLSDSQSNILLHVMEDHSGGLWVGSEYAGAFHLRVISDKATYLYPAGESHLEYANMVRALAVMGDDVWLCTRDGKVHIYDRTTLKKRKTRTFDANIYAAAIDQRGREWLGTRGNGLLIDSKRYLRNPQDSTSLSSNDIYCMVQDDRGRMWIGTFGGGLNLAEETPDGYRFRTFFTGSYSQCRIRTLYKDRRGWIWVGTNDGILLFHPDALLRDPNAYYAYNCRTKHLRSNEVRSIIEDRKGRMWIAETGVGFAVCTPENNYEALQFTHYNVENGLAYGMVQSFVEDRAGQLWIPTEYGISCFNPESEHFRNYVFSATMQNNVCCENSVLMLPDGRLAVGTNHGLALISPERVEVSDRVATVTFTDLKINGISTSPAEKDSPITRSIAYNPPITLRHDQNSLLVEFSTLDYAYPNRTQYSYRLEDYDTSWSTPSDLNFAGYKNLEPGEYRLHVRACNSMGIWNEQGASLSIRIRPPFWRTKIAYLVMCLLCLAILYGAYRILRKMTELRNKIAIEQQLTEYKLVFFTNISHEFRTPLTLILSALERMRRTMKIEGEQHEAMRVMEKGSQRMMRLVNQLLEFRKMQNNKLALSLEKTDAIAYIYEIWLLFKDAATAKQIEFTFEPTQATYSMYIDKGMVDKITYNLLSNALKYTPTGGSIRLLVSVDEFTHRFTISVKDSGVGIPPEKRNQLFSRFMHSSFSTNSVGVGLHLTHELVTVHKGSIRYTENPDGGSIFTVSLPTDTSQYAAGDFLLTSALDRSDCEEREPVDENMQHDTAVSTQSGTMKPINPQHILIIEDDMDIRSLIAEELAPWFTVATAADGNEGLSYLHEHPEIELIICDVMMPGMNGYEVTRHLKNNIETCHIPVVLLTALSSPESHLEGIESGADAYITKPFSAKLVLARVLKLIEQRSRLKEKFSNDLSVKSTVLCASDKDRAFIDRLNAILETQLNNPTFSAEDFASDMAMGRSVFYSKVRSVTGYAPKEYIRIVRLKRAADLLLTTQMTSAEIAYSIGIHDPSYFSKCFKEQFGKTPKAYRKEADEQTEA